MMSWLELGQRVEGLKEDLENMRPDREYPYTLEKIIECAEQMLHLMDFADVIERSHAYGDEN